jgi:solute:Na+ symporter, SSS family
VLLMVFSLLVTTQFDKISDAWRFILACSGGIGLVLLLRWFWWRVNAWTEIAAMLAPYAVYPFLVFYLKLEYELTLIIIVGWSTLVWLVVMFSTKPASMTTLKAFYTRVHPGGPGWKPVAEQLPEVQGDTGYKQLFVNYISGCILVMFSLFGTGKLIFGQTLQALAFFAIAILAGAVIYYNLSRIGWEKLGR